MLPSADSTWFNFRLDGGGEFAVYAFSGFEEVHRPYEFSIELVSTSANEDITARIGKNACLSIADRSGSVRPVHGLVAQMEQLHTSNKYTHYRCTIVPRLWFLDAIVDHRIFQKKSVVEIIEKILKEQGFSSGDVFDFQLAAAYEPREYCVQYGETDLHFISRLCEEEGIYFYHEHTEQNHKLCFCDKENGPPIPGNPVLRCFSGSGQRPDTAVISSLSLHQQVVSNAATYREWNFRQPRLNQEVSGDEPAPEKAPVPQGMLLEQYRYPHLHATPQKSGQEPGTWGERYAAIQLLRQTAVSRWVEGTTDAATFVPSFVFTPQGHPNPLVNTPWWVVRTEHHGEQPGVLQHEAPSERGQHYRASFLAIPTTTRFVPPAAHPKRLALSDQTAIVTGPEGEEIYPDKYGRVKVQFFWDREGKWEENSTCWIRSAQSWAGTQYGAMALPRIGHEVVVSFLEGNPDRPLITGRVYHELNMPPYPLPDNKTRTVFKSMNTPGPSEDGKEKPRGYNEFRIEDQKGAEEIYVHGEKNVNSLTRHDWKEYVIADYHESVGNERRTWLRPPAEEGGDAGQVHHIGQDQRFIELKEKDCFLIHDDSHSDYKTKWLAEAGEEIHLESLMKAVTEADADLTLKVGPSFIHMSSAGIEIVGPRVDINPPGGSPDGGPGEGTPVEADIMKGGALKTAGVSGTGLSPAYSSLGPSLAAENSAIACTLCKTK
ncbi:MAG: type VI secretion system tip protein VgrG [Desulfovibrio sp.]|jgi:type VI secretion system secreted protein VgrG|nr:type VI secretion system tip protein VgrG [Desulfovibrio sp.]